MAFSSLPNRQHFFTHEKLILLPESSGNIYLDPIKNTSYFMVATATTTVNILDIYLQYDYKLNMPDNSFMQLYFIFLPISTSMSLLFNSSIVFDELSTPPTPTVQQWRELHFNFFSFDSGQTWNHVIAGSFGPYTNTAVSRNIITKNGIDYTYSKVYNTNSNYIYFESMVPV